MLKIKSDQTPVHSTAIVDASAHLEGHVQVAPYAVIGKCAHIGEGTTIDSHTVIGDYTRIGKNCRIHSHAVVGSPSQDLKHRGAVSFLEIGDNNVIREFVTINRASAEGAITRIGNDNLLMAYVHVAHDCQLGDRIVLANNVTLGGHVIIEDDAVLGAMSGIHQFVKIGKMVMVGAMSRICQDVPPFMLVVGFPPKVYGINVVGLRRRGINGDGRKALKQAYQLLYRKALSLSNALQEIKDMATTVEMETLIDFLENSQRGICGMFIPEV